MSNETFLGSRRLWMPESTNNHDENRRELNGNVRKSLPFSELPSNIDFAGYLPSGEGNGVKPAHLAETLAALQTNPGKLIVKASSSILEKLFSTLDVVLKAHGVDHLTVDSSMGETPLNLLSLVQTAKRWKVPLLIKGNGSGVPAEVTQSILGANIPVALGVTDQLVYQRGFQVLTIN